MITIERAVDLNGPIPTETLRGAEYATEQNAHTFRISAFDGDTPVILTGSVSGSALLGNGDSLTIAGTIESGVAVLTLPQACYEIPGRFLLAIFNIVTGSTDEETVKTCIYACIGNVVNTVGSSVYDPGGVIPDAETLAAYIEACQTATAAANAAASHSVRYDTSQTIDATGQATARANISAAMITVSGTTLTVS